MSLQVKVITPEKIIWDTTSEQIILPSTGGDLGILADHAPLATVLEPGVVRKKTEEGWKPLVLFGGFAEVEDNQLIILGNGAEEITPKLKKDEVEEMLNTVSETFETVKQNSDDQKEIEAAALEVKIAKARVTALTLLKK